MRELYAERLGVLLEEGRRQLAGAIEISQIEAGLQTVGWLAGDLEGRRLVQAATERGLEMIALAGFYLSTEAWEQRQSDGVQMGFAAVSPEEIRRGMEELARTIEGLRTAAAGG
jgi:GntR family transcriptional regulator/MocR family aminotransferase